MEFKWEDFQSGYNSADERTKRLVESSSIADCIEKEIKTGSIDPNLQPMVLLGITHLLLKTVSKEELTKHFTAEGVPQASAVIDKIQTCISEIKKITNDWDNIKDDKTGAKPQTNKETASDTNKPNAGTSKANPQIHNPQPTIVSVVNTIPKPTVSTPPTAVPIPKPEEPPLKTIQHIRTMAEDMSFSHQATEKTYTSTQEAILKEGSSSK